jgi:stage V sporulation protein D (sporulation-specific penicillin-binding protein)
MRVSNVTVRKRLMFVLIAGILVFLVIDMRLGYVQFILGDKLTSKAKALWSRNVPFEPERGKILDRNGVELAKNESAPTVYAVPKQIKNPTEVAEKLARILEVPHEKIHKHLIKKDFLIKITPEGRKVSHEKAKEIRNLDLEGIYIAEDSKRYYPFGSYMSHVLGFAGIENQGLNGLELAYDAQLKGEEGNVKFFVDARNQKMPDMADDYTKPRNGYDLRLTTETKLQTILERELDNAVAQYNPDNIVAIAMNPKNGKILGMSSRPTFDPANYRNVDPIVYNRNLPVWSTYEPGSTFKIMTLAAALNEGKVDLQKDTFNDDGGIEIAGTTLHCWKRGGHGHQTFLQVVENSCNPGFIELGERLGKDKLFQYIYDFGFGKKTGIDLQGEGTGILFNPAKIGPVEQATTAFGQGVSVTAIQQVAAVAAAVNGGTLYQPYIAEAIIDSTTGKVIDEKKPVAKRQVITEETSKQVRQALESVVAKGSGKGAYVEGYRVGGKTGTAQKVKDGRYMEGSYIVSFMGVAPMDDPELVVYLAIDHPKGVTQFGGVVAAPIVGNIMKDTLPALGIEKRQGGIEKELVWPEQPLQEVPDLKGLTMEELQQQLEHFKLDISGKGNKVITQSPQAGEKVKEGSIIRIYLGDE